jgi:GDP-L-fucose synthase
MSRILVTGGTGFLGRVVVRLLEQRGDTVIALGRKDGDLTLASTVNVSIARQRPDAVIHLAALCGGIGANRESPADFLTANALMGLHVLRACVDWKVPKVVMMGTICAYPKFTPVPFNEDDMWNGYPEETNAPYGVAKRMLLVAAQAYRAQYGLNAVTLFPTNLYGVGDTFEGEDNHVIPALIARLFRAAQMGEQAVTLWGDGMPTREFLYVEDCAEAIVKTLDVYNEPGPLNLGSGEEVSIRDLATMIAEVVDFRGKLEWDTSKPNGQPRRKVDSSRAHAALGWRSKVKIAEGLRRTFERYAGDL